ncbi:hypothetical protein [Wolbachia endosymbiont of Brugia pahangi]|uniref:hypothetical protein n=1 Tax=Wolbachia endosymbiont of Brugia pahangi TaxID=96495 RepID=UPI001438741E|nr:hypothetical protein [Wolbachia endosymbiont of Brugia pahangi]
MGYYLVVNDELNNKLRNAYYVSPVIENGKLFIMSNKEIMFLLGQGPGVIKEVISLPKVCTILL